MGTKTMNVETIYLRFITRRDVGAVLAIERDCFGELAWSQDYLTETLRDKAVIGLVCEVGAVVAGYVIYQLRSQEILILNLGVCLNYRFHGLGRRIIETVISKLSFQRISTVRCFIRESNLDAQLFFRSLGFEAVNILKRPFHGLDDDAYEFRYMVGQPICDTRLLDAESSY
jgi:[ribosomal protein S18]-alanine N-acetyltransferase